MFALRTLSGAVLLLLTCGFQELPAQTCSLSVAGLNQNRFVWGWVNEECGPVHDAPWGNWGVTSNYGQKQDGDQFQGWKPKWSKLTFRWQLQWNSCTSGYPPPSCDYYNWNACTQQRDLYTVNVHGTKFVTIQVNCPQDTNDDGDCDTGGCKDVFAYGEWTNWMTLYELDWPDADDLVETLYFPTTNVYLTCNPGWCSAAGTAWQAPTSGWVTDARMAMVVNYGVYYDSVNCEYLRFSNPKYDCRW